MPDFIFLMHGDASGGANDGWEQYLSQLRSKGVFEGGSAIGDGICLRKEAAGPSLTKHLTGYIRITAANLNDAKQLVAGNPVYEAGGTVEIRELPRD